MRIGFCVAVKRVAAVGLALAFVVGASAQGMRPIWRIGNAGFLSMDVTPDGRYLVTSGSHLLQVFDLQLNTLVQTKLTKGYGRSTACLPDAAQVLAFTGRNESQQNNLQLLTLPGGSVVHDFPNQTGDLAWFLPVSPDGKYFYTVSGSSIYENRTDTGNAGRVLTPGGGGIWISRNQKYLTCMDDDGVARLFDLPTGQVLKSFDTGERPFSTSCTDDGQYVVTMTFDGIVRVWNGTTGFLVYAWDIGASNGQDSYVRVTPDNAYVTLVTYKGDAYVWSLATGQQVNHFDTGLYGVRSVLQSDGRTLIVNGLFTSYDWRLRGFDIFTGESVAVPQTANGSSSTLMSPDGSVFGGGGQGTMKLYSGETGESLGSFTATYTDGSWADFSPDNTLLAMDRDKNGVAIVRVADGSLVTNIVPGPRVVSCKFSPDGRYLAVYGDVAVSNYHYDAVYVYDTSDWTSQSKSWTYGSSHDVTAFRLFWSPDSADLYLVRSEASVGISTRKVSASGFVQRWDVLGKSTFGLLNDGSPVTVLGSLLSVLDAGTGQTLGLIYLPQHLW
ncbi:MAG: WD40 repeat domain-containing protein [Armatimonadetes bacterium]|nr:WD40 repeat domain-containing protein [Armatimonadota bacterium]